ncbi:hypothetical protein [Streptomyces sp. NPDC006267]|uniref:hypothetical protein n=1 Tax=Streptomyces sp. NPDC006267 TaxID=3157173 RepID=UPI0033A60A7A
MPILAGQIVTAAQLNRLQPKTFRAAATSPLAGPVALTDVPGATITLTTEMPNAVYVATAWFDYRVTSTSGTGLGSGNVDVDGSIHSEYAVFRDSHAAGATAFTDSVGHTYRGVLPAAGSHTLKLIAAPSTGQQVNVYSSITVVVYEVV